jgi:NAD(P)-dependent dehydrogenase (short-subunit alcohol dehydrogenase family)
VLDVSPAPSAKDEPELNALIDSGRVRYYKCDISDSTQVQSSVDDIQRDFDGDPISILINNAGIVNAKPLEDLSEQEIRRTFGVNCLAHFWTVRSVLPIMKRQRYGHLVTISSTMGLTAVSGMSMYICVRVRVCTSE